MNTKMKTINGIAIVVLMIYVTFPFFAGLCDLGGDRRGPKIYNRSHHEILYRLGYSLVRNERPRVPFDRDRQWFYQQQGTHK